MCSIDVGRRYINKCNASSSFTVRLNNGKYSYSCMCIVRKFNGGSFHCRTIFMMEKKNQQKTIRRLYHNLSSHYTSNHMYNCAQKFRTIFYHSQYNTHHICRYIVYHGHAHTLRKNHFLFENSLLCLFQHYT